MKSIINQFIFFVKQDLSSHDLNRNRIYLICYAVRTGSMEMKEYDARRTSVSSQNSNGTVAGNHRKMRRPFGVAAHDLTLFIRKPEDFKNHLDMPFILCEKENLDNTLKKLIANKDCGKIESKLAVSVDVLHGDIKQVMYEKN